MGEREELITVLIRLVTDDDNKNKHTYHFCDIKLLLLRGSFLFLYGSEKKSGPALLLRLRRTTCLPLYLRTFFPDKTQSSVRSSPVLSRGRGVVLGLFVK